MREFLLRSVVAALAALAILSTAYSGDRGLSARELDRFAAGPFAECGSPTRNCEQHVEHASGPGACITCPTNPPGQVCCKCVSSTCGECSCEWAWDWWCSADTGDLCDCGGKSFGMCAGTTCGGLVASGQMCGIIWATCCR